MSSMMISMPNRWKVLICGLGAYLFQTFALSFFLNPIVDVSAQLIGEDYFYNPDMFLQIVLDVLFYILPAILIITVAAYIYLRWGKVQPTFSTSIKTIVGFLIAYAIGGALSWVFAFAVIPDASFTELQWVLVGALDGFQEVEGYAVQYFIGWALYLAPFPLGVYVAHWLLRGRTHSPLVG